MPNRMPAIFAGSLTIVLLILCGVIFIGIQIIALNGATERQGMHAMLISLTCQSAGAIVTAIFAHWLTKRLIVKFNWNTLIAVIAAVILATAVGVVIASLATVVAIPLAGIH